MTEVYKCKLTGARLRKKHEQIAEPLMAYLDVRVPPFVVVHSARVVAKPLTLVASTQERHSKVESEPEPMYVGRHHASGSSIAPPQPYLTWSNLPGLRANGPAPGA